MFRLSPITLRGTGVLIAGVVMCTAATATGVRELLYYGIVFLAVLACAIIYVLVARRAPRVQRTVSTDVVRVGETSRLHAVIDIRSVLPTPSGEWEDVLPEALDGDAAGTLPALGSGTTGSDRTVRVAYDVTGVRRGTTSVGPLRLVGTDPFGLIRRVESVRPSTEITVGPEIIALPQLSFPVGEAGGTQNTTTAQYGEGADNLIARPYAPGDSMRRIHWRATAHRDELMVRQEEQETTPEATVIIDRHGPRWGERAASLPGSDPAFELGVSMAASAAAHLVSEGYLVSVIDTDGRELCDRLHAQEDIDDMTAHLATLRGTHDDELGHLRPLLAGAMSGPLVLIIGRYGDAERALVGGLAVHSTFPVLIAGTAEQDAIDIAHAAGWHTASLAEGVREAWLAATEERLTYART